MLPESQSQAASACRLFSVAPYLLGLCVSTLFGCEPDLKFPRLENDDAAVSPVEAGAGVCMAMPDGSPCGSEQHCIGELCLTNTCGDGIKAGDEQCDDGAQLTEDGCSPACLLVPVTCGNGLVEEGEECDDGDNLPGNACSTECTQNRCGNARRDFGEECDDGNTDEDDFCSAACTRNLCRDGNTDPGEECDDGNNIETDGCTNACLAIKCGDGIVQPDPPLHEECDDANSDDGDDCSNKCLENRCGNFRVDVGELCDSNKCEGGKVCNATCDGCEDDACDQCLRSKCENVVGFDVYTPCLAQATSDNLLNGNQPGPTFTEDCTNLLSCIRFTGCYDYNPTFFFNSCVCEDRPYRNPLTECDQLSGPCLDVLDKAMRNGDEATSKSCSERSGSGTFGSCLEGNQQDTTKPSGYVYFLLQCMQSDCRAECGLPAP